MKENTEKTLYQSKYDPRHTRVIIKRKDTETVTKSGILIAHDAEIKYVEGTIIKVGPEVDDLKAGDYVLFDKFCTYQDLDDGTIILDEADVLAVISK